MTELRPDIVDLLHTGLSDRAISRQLRCDAKTVSKTRAALGLPKARSGYRPADSVEELFQLRTEQVEGGHLRWTGHIDPNGLPRLRHGGRLHTAHRVAFRIRTGREPVGLVRTVCDVPGCVEPRHVADTAERARDRQALAAILPETT